MIDIIREKLEGRQVLYLKKTQSTNADLMAAVRRGDMGSGDMIIARQQTDGKGRTGKSFMSPKGGLYMSFCVGDVQYGLSTVICAVAVAEAMAKQGASPKVKWVNDIFIKDRKVCGILAQAVGDGSHAVIGVGINLLKDALPTEIRDIATGLDEECQPDTAALVCDIITNYEKLSAENRKDGSARIVKCYKELLFHMNREVTVVTTGERALCVDVDSDGALIVEQNGNRKKLSSGEISIKI